MGAWIRKWHVVLAVVIGLYLAIPKPTEPIAQFGNVETFVTGTTFTSDTGEKFTLDKSVNVVTEERNGKEFYVFVPGDIRMLPKDPDKPDEVDTAYDTLYVEKTKAYDSWISSSAAFQLKIPLAAYKPNLGQDLAGGTSLRYHISSGDAADAQARMYEILSGWKASNVLDDAAVPAAFKAKANAYLAAKDSGDLPERPGDSLLPNDAEIDAFAAAAVVSPDQVHALRNARAEFTRIAKETATADATRIDDTINLLQDRLNKSGMTELNIVKAGESEIEVKLPALAPSELERIKQTLRTTGRLEFILLPSDKVFGEGKSAKDVYPGLPEKDAQRYRWYDVDPAVIASSLRARNLLTYNLAKKAFVENPVRDSKSSPAFSASTWTVVTDRKPVKTRFSDKDGLEHEAWVTPEVCLVQISYPQADNPDADLRGYPIKGTSLKSAEASSDSTSGQPAVSFELKGEGVTVMSTITKSHTKDGPEGDPRNLAVAIDRKLYSAPSINAELSDRVQVTGSFTRAEVKQYVSILKAGSLSVELKPLGEESIGPAEGADNIKRGWISLLVGAGLVLLFAVVFYRRTGVLTMLNLILTVVLIVAIMSLFLSTLTLPGIAGLVLTLGMAIDANILINERIREEREAGASGRTAIELGFKKAFSAIIDGNVTTLITALILTKVGTGAVAGFALTLSIGILCTLYTALVVYRTTLFWCYDKGLIPEVRGANLFRNTNYNILGVGKKLAIVNFILMLAAFSFFVYDAADGDVFGVDFRGGTQIVMQLKEPVTRDQLQDKLDPLKADKHKFPDIHLQARNILGDETDTGVGSKRWEVTVPMPAGEALDGEAALARRDEIVSDIASTVPDLLAESGYQPEVVDPRAVDFEINLTLTRPANATEDDDTRPWLNDATNGKFLSEPFDTWFGSGFGTLSLDVLSSSETTQDVRFAAHDVSVLDHADAETKWQTFHRTIADKFRAYPEAAAIIVLGPDADRGAKKGFPEFQSYHDSLHVSAGASSDSRMSIWVRLGAVQAKISLMAPLTLKQFTDAFSAEARASDVRQVSAMADNPDAVSLPDDAKAGEPSSLFIIKTVQSELFTLEEGQNAKRTQNVVQELEIVIAKLDTRLRDDPDLQSGTTQPFPKASVIGGRIAGETQARALLALVIALIAIVIYVGLRFKSTGWGLASVAALVHDTMFTLGAIAAIDYTFGHQLGFDLKIDLNAIAALLTVIGYSLNDTIIIFDRIREELVDDLKLKRERSLDVVINTAVNRTLARTVLTSLSTFIVVLAMVFLGGPAIRTFAWTLLFGLIFGTYSSIFRAGPFLLLFTSRSGDLRATIEREEAAKEEARLAELADLAAVSTDREVEDSEFAEHDFEGAEFGHQAVAEAAKEAARKAAEADQDGEKKKDS